GDGREPRRRPRDLPALPAARGDARAPARGGAAREPAHLGPRDLLRVVRDRLRVRGAPRLELRALAPARRLRRADDLGERARDAHGAPRGGAGRAPALPARGAALTRAAQPVSSRSSGGATHLPDGLRARVAILGSGPTGAAAALALLQRGVDDVLLLDSHPFPRDKTCGSGLSPRAIEILRALEVWDEDVKPIAYPIRALRIVTRSGREAVVSAGERHPGAGGPRPHFDPRAPPAPAHPRPR